MGRTYITVFLTAAGVVILCLLTILAFLIGLIVKLIFGTTDGMQYSPLGPQIQFLIGIGPFLSLLVVPLLAIVALSLLVVFSLRRWRGKGNHISYERLHDPKICVALTAYNDEESISESVADFLNQTSVAKVVVVDNNSTDETAIRASRAGAQVFKEPKQGYGYACIRGLREALGIDGIDVIGLCEGDRTFRAYDINKMIPYLDNVDMVIGTRTTQELLDQKSQLDWFYVWGNLFLAKILQIKFWDVKHWGRVRLTDVGCTFRLMRRDALTKMINDLVVGGDHFSPHMVMVAISKGFKVIEVPITFRERVGKSKGAGSNKKKAIKVGLSMLWHILEY